MAAYLPKRWPQRRRGRSFTSRDECSKRTAQLLGRHLEVASKWFPGHHRQPSYISLVPNVFPAELNEKEVIELLENLAPGSINKATKYGVKIFHGKNLRTFVDERVDNGRATITPQITDLIGWMKKNNRAARAARARFFMQIFDVVRQTTTWNFHI